jgi:hypothetical protein
MEPLGESSLEKAGRRFQVLRWPPYYLRAVREWKKLRLPISRTLPCPEWYLVAAEARGLYSAPGYAFNRLYGHLN